MSNNPSYQPLGAQPSQQQPQYQQQYQQQQPYIAQPASYQAGYQQPYPAYAVPAGAAAPVAVPIYNPAAGIPAVAVSIDSGVFYNYNRAIVSSILYFLGLIVFLVGLCSTHWYDQNQNDSVYLGGGQYLNINLNIHYGIFRNCGSANVYVTVDECDTYDKYTPKLSLLRASQAFAILLAICTILQLIAQMITLCLARSATASTGKTSVMAQRSVRWFAVFGIICTLIMLPCYLAWGHKVLNGAQYGYSFICYLVGRAIMLIGGMIFRRNMVNGGSFLRRRQQAVLVTVPPQPYNVPSY